MPEWKEEIRRRLANLSLEPAREAEIVEELAQHLDDRHQALLSDGAGEEDAYGAALAELSDSQLLARELRRVERPPPREPVVLGTRRKNMIGSLWQDLRYGLRMLLRSPIFTTVAVLTLTLGIGANTVIFSLVNALLFKPLPAVQEPEQLTYLSGSYSYPEYEGLRDGNDVFTGLLAQGGTTSLNLNTGAEPELVVGELVTANFFSVLGVNAAMGRGFLPEEDHQPGAHPVAVISHGLWQRRFGSQCGSYREKHPAQRSAIHHRRRYAAHVYWRRGGQAARSLGPHDDASAAFPVLRISRSRRSRQPQ